MDDKLQSVNGGYAIADTLKRHGVEAVFGMTGGQTPFTASLIQAGIRLATVRDERCGALMAIGYARAAGRPGICTAADIGSAHLAVGLHEAYNSSLPVVAITSDLAHARAWRTGGRFIDQEALFRPFTKWTVRVQDADTLRDVVRRALHLACSGEPGPVVVIVPGGLLWGDATAAVSETDGPVQIPALRVSPDTSSIERARDMLTSARRAVIVAGGGVVLSGAANELAALAEALGMPVATTHMAHGVFPGRHPLYAGVLGDATARSRGRVANQLVMEADVVLLLGTRMDAATTRGWTLPSRNTRAIQVDIDADSLNNNVVADVAIAADARSAIEALNAAVSAQQHQKWAAVAAERQNRVRDLTAAWRTEEAARAERAGATLCARQVFPELQKVIDPDTMVVVDAGSCSYWAAALLELGPDNKALHPRGYPALGSALPMAMGAQIADPRHRVLAISGDGAFGYNIMELETARRLRLPIVNIVINNQTLGMEWNSFIRYCGEPLRDAVRFEAQDFAAVARALDCRGVRVTRREEVAPAVAAALSANIPGVVEIMTDPAEDSGDEVPWQFS